jgi:hypothetical protein
MTFRIDISHNLILYKLLYYKLECLGWNIQANAQLDNPMWVKFPNQVGTCFALDVEKKDCSWIGGEDSDGNGFDCDMLTTMEDVEALMDFIKENVDLMKNVPVPVDPPKPTWKPIASESMWGTNPCQEVPLDPYKYGYGYGSSGKSMYGKSAYDEYYDKPKSYQHQIDKLLDMKQKLIHYYNDAAYYNESPHKVDAIVKKIYAIEEELGNLGHPAHTQYATKKVKQMGGYGYDKYSYDPYYNDPYSSPYKYKKGGYGW